MITKMIYYSFLLYHRDADQFMERLQSLGVMDIKRSVRERSPEELAVLSTVDKYSRTVRVMKVMAEGRTADFAEGAEILVNKWEEALNDKDRLIQLRGKLAKEVEEVSVWGNFDTDIYTRISALGLKLRFFSCLEKNFGKNWEEEYPISIIAKEKGFVYFTVLDDRSSEIDIAATEVKAPASSAKAKIEELAQVDARIKAVKETIAELAPAYPVLEAEQKTLLNGFDFNDAKLSNTSSVENTILMFEGYVPEEQSETLKQFLEEEGVIYTSRDVQKGENAPILLKNNKFSRLFESISKLYAMPTYDEYDLTPLLAPFFMLFFGFCLGDGGYGLVLVLFGALLKKKMPAMKDMLSLVQVLGVATMVFSIFTGSFFGMALGDTEMFAAYKDKFLTFDGMFTLSLIVGGIQIIFGMVVKALNRWRRFGFVHSLSTFGWVILILSCVYFAFLGDPEDQMMKLFGTVHLIILGICGIAIFFLNSPGKNPAANFGLGIWDSYNVATGLLGDMLSYIRLFALNLSGSVLGGVFNSLAVGLSPDIPVVGTIVTILILVFGHSINIFMSALGSFVHPVRLTFVEFYKNTGFEGAGKAYNPFKIRK